MRRMTAAASLVLAVLVAAPLGAVERLTPLVVGWEQFFKLDWQVAERGQQPLVWGHLLNDWGDAAGQIQLLVEGFDSSGSLVGQKVAWLGTTLTPGMRGYFEVPVPWKAPTYRVSVFAFEWIQAGGDQFP
ncbi:MAG TPA: hypothetical protein VFR64_12575 [Methylomirabilota bacterium]|nr:hypothetical protein [Methylomirabilota bacterium]